MRYLLLSLVLASVACGAPQGKDEGADSNGEYHVTTVLLKQGLGNPANLAPAAVMYEAWQGCYAGYVLTSSVKVIASPVFDSNFVNNPNAAYIYFTWWGFTQEDLAQAPRDVQLVPFANPCEPNTQIHANR